MLVVRSFGVLIFDWSHVLTFLLWCGLRVFSISLFCTTDQCGSLVFLCLTSEDFITNYNINYSYERWPLKAAFDYMYMFCMRPSHDIDQDTLENLTTLGVVDLDIFDSRKLVVRVLPGEFVNTIRMLVPDATAMPIGFHDVMMENLITMPDRYRQRILPPSKDGGRPLCLWACISGRPTWSPCAVTVSGNLMGRW